MTIAEYLTTHPVTLTILEGPNETSDAAGWQHFAYRLELQHNACTLVTPWRQGTGITDDPDVATVLDSLASDSLTVYNAQSFEDWAAELGYDTDSRKAYATYGEVRAQADKLRKMLGDEATDTLLHKVERL